MVAGGSRDISVLSPCVSLPSTCAKRRAGDKRAVFFLAIIVATPPQKTPCQRNGDKHLSSGRVEV